MLFFLSLAALAVAPIISRSVARYAPMAAFLDGFVVVAITGLVCLHVLPEAISKGGWTVGVAAAVGLALPTVLEKVLHRVHTSVHRGTVLLVAVGLALHAFFDGMALSVHGHGPHGHAHGGHDHLALAVVVHRLPEALLIWSVARPVSARFAWSLLGLIGGATAVGYGAADWVHVQSSWAFIDGLVAGALLHVALAAHGHWRPHAEGRHGHDGAHKHDDAHHANEHDHAHHAHEHAHHAHEHDHAHHEHEHAHHAHEHDHAHHEHDHAHHEHDHAHHGHGHEHHDHAAPEHSGWAATGALVAAALLAWLGGLNEAFSGDGLSFVDTFVTLAFESAPALLFAFVGAGLVRGLLTPASTRWISRGAAASQAAKGMAFGLPLPVCSCGVLPLYEGLVRAGVPATAGLAFLIATPELGLDAILISIPLLGGELTVARLIAAAVVAFVTAIVLGRLLRTATPSKSGGHEDEPQQTRSARVRAGLRFGLFELVDHTLPWVLVGLAIAAICEPMLAHAGLRSLPTGLDVFIFALIGAPIYVCATGATPLAAVLIHAGVSPGAALAFLLTGPATNVTTFGVLARLHGRRGAVLFGLGVLTLAVVVGLLVNLAVPAAQVPALHQAAATQPSVLQSICLALLGMLFLSSLFRQGPRGLIGQVTDAVHAH